MSELAAAYYSYQATQDDADAWAWERVNVLGFERPTDKWSQLLALVAAAPDDIQIALLGAGPLEDLLRYHASDVVELLEGEIQGNARLRAALANVWLQGAHPVRANDAQRRVERLLASL